MTNSLPPLREIIAFHELMANKTLGQHFLLDANLLSRVVQCAGDISHFHVIEIGPGPGGLTRALLGADPFSVTAVEKDTRCVHALQSLVDAAQGKLRVIEADALEFDLTQVPTPRAVVANLPYNVGTALLTRWLDALAEGTAIERMTLMFQKEVAQRLLATPRSKEYGRLSVYAQWLCDIADGFDIPPGAFVPPPKITSTVVTLTPKKSPLKVDKRALEKVLAAAFNQRRKMLRGSLKSLGVDVSKLLEASAIDGTRRAEELSVAEFCKLANALK